MLFVMVQIGVRKLENVTVSNSLYFILFIFLENTSPFLWGHWNPCFGFLVMSPLGFKARVGSLIHLINKKAKFTHHWQADEVLVIYIPFRRKLLLFTTTHKWSLEQGNVFTSVCHSVQMWWGEHSKKACGAEGVCIVQMGLCGKC